MTYRVRAEAFQYDEEDGNHNALPHTDVLVAEFNSRTEAVGLINHLEAWGHQLIRLRELLGAAQTVLNNLEDADETGPTNAEAESQEAKHYHRDEQGKLWFRDLWVLHQAVQACRAPQEPQIPEEETPEEDERAEDGPEDRLDQATEDADTCYRVSVLTELVNESLDVTHSMGSLELKVCKTLAEADAFSVEVQQTAEKKSLLPKGPWFVRRSGEQEAVFEGQPGDPEARLVVQPPQVSPESHKELMFIAATPELATAAIALQAHAAMDRLRMKAARIWTDEDERAFQIAVQMLTDANNRMIEPAQKEEKLSE